MKFEYSSLRLPQSFTPDEVEKRLNEMWKKTNKILVGAFNNTVTESNIIFLMKKDRCSINLNR